MRRFYQEGWQGIPFSVFTEMSFFHLADARFYSSFYEVLFSRYGSWAELPEAWRDNKTRDALWLQGVIEKLKNSREGEIEPFRVLSIGAGVGFMEKLLVEALPDVEFHVNEPSTVGMKWLRDFIPPERIYIGQPPACLPADMKWNLIYLSAVDYSISQWDMRKLLEELRSQLTDGGMLVNISSSLLEEYSFIGGLVNSMKIVIRMFLHYLAIRRQQFWGWRRTRKEYQQLFKISGFTDIKDGFLDDGFDNFWISGVK